jgi:hypothetical protein
MFVEDGITAQYDPAAAGITDFLDTGTNVTVSSFFM